MDNDDNTRLEYLLKVLESGGYNAKPSKLRQGTIYFIADHELSEEELDDLWIETFGHKGY